MRYIILFLLFPASLWAQNRITVSGIVTDGQSGEAVIGAMVYNPVTRQGVATNTFGYYSITLECDSGTGVAAKYLGFDEMRIPLICGKDTVINFSLQRNTVLQEVTVSGSSRLNANPELSGLSFRNIDMQMIQRAPVILGERDALKTLQFLPGIKGGRENTANFNVRGGSHDQNLILLDGIPVYNVNHLFGFFSVFNTEAIKNVTLIKGGMPARYGGRLSSIVDIAMKEGNMKRMGGAATISPIAASLTFETPLKKDVASMIVSARRTYIDLPLLAIQKLSGHQQNSGYMFYDLNVKGNWIINRNNRLYASMYWGNDKFFHNAKESKYKSRNDQKWGNFAASLRYNKTFSSKLFGNFSAYFSRFHNTLDFESNYVSMETEYHATMLVSSQLRDANASGDFEYFAAPGHTIRGGIKGSYLLFNPSILQIKGTQSEDLEHGTVHYTAYAGEAYIENYYTRGRFDINAGLRFSSYITEEKPYYALQPRIAAGFDMRDNIRINASYARMSQYLHMLTTNSVNGFPAELWVPSTERIPMQKGWQVTLGSRLKFEKMPTIEIEAYYREMNNVLMYAPGTTFLMTTEKSWEDLVIVGKGRAYGVEFMTEKKTGRFTGMFSYTLAWSQRQFNGVNRDRWFPHQFDRRHDLSVLGEYALKPKGQKRRSVSAGFTLQSGNKLSMPDMEYNAWYLPFADFYDSPTLYDKNMVIRNYKNPNNFRMPTFHHLDLAYNVDKNKSDTKSWSWNFSIYNVYNRLNPWYYYKNNQGITKSVSIFPIIPSVSFTYRW